MIHAIIFFFWRPLPPRVYNIKNFSNPQWTRVILHDRGCLRIFAVGKFNDVEKKMLKQFLLNCLSQIIKGIIWDAFFPEKKILKPWRQTRNVRRINFAVVRLTAKIYSMRRKKNNFSGASYVLQQRDIHQQRGEFNASLLAPLRS